MAEKRPSPDELLARMKAEEQQKHQGRLTIFLGYAAGVGKTYAMLEAAQQRKKEIDLVVGYAETHGRAETESLLKGLEIIPRRQTEYRGVQLTEMDLDAVLARRPQLALVDELAHTNAPGSRHPKRYQDIEELLDAGIDVYTTLNAQHVESARDKVAQITSAWVRETVPDTIVDRATEIKLVDLPPDELIRRLKEGKVYVPEQVLHATSEFFRKGNLTALREVTMRLAAEHVDKQMRAYMQRHAVRGPWHTAERLLVCISPGPLGNRMVRNARILASQLNAEWFAAYVETPDSVLLSSTQQDRLVNTLRFAERLGAKTLKLRGQSVAQTIMEYANTHNITKPGFPISN
jgi:two-component system sensor histidine kinase KdpD